MKRLSSTWFLLAAGALATSACATLKALSGDGEAVVYGDDADSNLKKGEEALASKNFPDAQRYFEFVKTKYPFLEAAKTAELLLGDTDMERERFVEARDRYQNFVRLHPTHPKVAYAAWRAALTHYKDIPADYFFLPSSREKDQVEVRGARTAVEGFLNEYPKSEYVAEAKKVLDDVKHRLAEHELAIADFYKSRDRWNAVIGRLATVEREYPGIGFDEQVSFGLYDAYRKLSDEPHAREALRVYVSRFPGTEGARRAEKILATAMPEAPRPAPDGGTR